MLMRALGVSSTLLPINCVAPVVGANVAPVLVANV